MQFDTEAQLVETALNTTFIKELIKDKPSTIIKEPKGLFGRPDVVVGTLANHEEQVYLSTFAFEMKLSNWKRALTQAFRYRAFACKAYVVLDAKYIHRAIKNRDKFEKSNIGLMSITLDGGVQIYVEPKALTPYSSQLQTTFSTMLCREIQKTPMSYCL